MGKQEKEMKTHSTTASAGLGSSGDGRAALGAGTVGVDERLHGSG